MATSDSFSIVFMSQKDPRAKYLIKNVIQYIELNQDKNDVETRAASTGILSQEYIGFYGKYIGTTGIKVQYSAVNVPTVCGFLNEILQRVSKYIQLN